MKYYTIDYMHKAIDIIEFTIILIKTVLIFTGNQLSYKHSQQAGTGSGTRSRKLVKVPPRACRECVMLTKQNVIFNADNYDKIKIWFAEDLNSCDNCLS